MTEPVVTIGSHTVLTGREDGSLKHANGSMQPFARSLSHAVAAVSQDDKKLSPGVLASLARIALMRASLSGDTIPVSRMASSLVDTIPSRESHAAAPARGAQSYSTTARVHKKTEFTALAEKAAGRYNVDPKLVSAVIKAESGFDHRAVSPAGAQGLMQLMPDTARELKVSDPFDPEQNVMAGSLYLKKLLEKYNGDLDRALAAYNWGPGNVDRHGLERMPAETRQYLSRVKNYMQGRTTA